MCTSILLYKTVTWFRVIIQERGSKRYSKQLCESIPPRTKMFQEKYRYIYATHLNVHGNWPFTPMPPCSQAATMMFNRTGTSIIYICDNFRNSNLSYELAEQNNLNSMGNFQWPHIVLNIQTYCFKSNYFHYTYQNHWLKNRNYFNFDNIHTLILTL